MISTRAVCVHGLDQAKAVLLGAKQLGVPAVLVSARGEAGFGGCGWWRALVDQAAAACGYPCEDWLDCADAPGYAMAALRVGQKGLILDAAVPALAAVRGAAASLGASVRTDRPPALDLARPAAARALDAWLRGEHDA